MSTKNILGLLSFLIGCINLIPGAIEEVEDATKAFAAAKDDGERANAVLEGLRSLVTLAETVVSKLP